MTLSRSGTIDVPVPGVGEFRVKMTIKDRGGGGFTVISVLDPLSVEVPGAVGRFSVKRGVARATLRDDDGPPRITVADLLLNEGDTGARPAHFAVSLSRAVEHEVAVRCSTADGSAEVGDDDYTEVVDLALVFAPGEIRRTVEVQVHGELPESLINKLMLDEPAKVRIRPQSDLQQVLADCEEYFDSRADADQPAGDAVPTPNEEMRLQMAIAEWRVV